MIYWHWAYGPTSLLKLTIPAFGKGLGIEAVNATLRNGGVSGSESLTRSISLRWMGGKKNSKNRCFAGKCFER